MADEAGQARVTVRELEEITKSANIPTLLMVIYQATGDPRWLRPPYCPTRSKGLGDHDTGGLPEDVQNEIRLAAARAFYDIQEGKPPAIPLPSPEQTSEMLGVCVGEEVDESYGVMFSQEFRCRIGAVERAMPRRATVPRGFRALIIGAGVSGIIAAQRLHLMGVPYLVVDKRDALRPSTRAQVGEALVCTTCAISGIVRALASPSSAGPSCHGPMKVGRAVPCAEIRPRRADDVMVGGQLYEDKVSGFAFWCTRGGPGQVRFDNRPLRPQSTAGDF